MNYEAFHNRGTPVYIFKISSPSAHPSPATAPSEWESLCWQGRGGAMKGVLEDGTEARLCLGRTVRSGGPGTAHTVFWPLGSPQQPTPPQLTDSGPRGPGSCTLSQHCDAIKRAGRVRGTWVGGWQRLSFTNIRQCWHEWPNAEMSQKCVVCFMQWNIHNKLNNTTWQEQCGIMCFQTATQASCKPHHQNNWAPFTYPCQICSEPQNTLKDSIKLSKFIPELETFPVLWKRSEGLTLKDCFCRKKSCTKMLQFVVKKL